MQWKEYRVKKSRVATVNHDGSRRVLELLDGRVLIELDGAPSQIVDAPFEKAKVLALALVPAGERVSWLGRLWRALCGLFGGAS
jgi:hypothetical protein